METTVKKLLLIEPSLTRLFTSPDLPANIAFRLAPVAKVISESLRSYNEQRVALIKKHGTFNPEREQYFVPEDALTEFEVKLNALAAEKVTLPNVTVFHQDVEHAKLSAIDLANLDFIILESKQRPS